MVTQGIHIKELFWIEQNTYVNAHYWESSPQNKNSVIYFYKPVGESFVFGKQKKIS